MSFDPAAQPPRRIRLAATLLWAAFALQVLMAVFDLVALSEDDIGLVAGIAVGALLLSITAAATFHFPRGRHWARVTLLVLWIMAVLGLFMLPALWDGADGAGSAPWYAGAYVLEVILTAVALYVAFTAPGGEWFRRSPKDAAIVRALLPVGRSGWAIAAGYLALFSVLLVPAPFALFCGLKARREIRRNPDRGGMGRAWFGIGMGVIGTLALVVIVAMALWRRGGV